MTDRRRFVRIFFVLLVFGLASLFGMLGKPSFQTIRGIRHIF